MYNENYKTSLKEIKEDTNKWNDIQCSWIGTLNTVMMSILIKVVYRFTESLIKIPMVLFVEIEKCVLNLTCNLKGFQITRTFF